MSVLGRLVARQACAKCRMAVCFVDGYLTTGPEIAHCSLGALFLGPPRATHGVFFFLFRSAIVCHAAFVRILCSSG